MSLPSIAAFSEERQTALTEAALMAGFIAPAFVNLSFDRGESGSRRLEGFASALVAAFPYGNNDADWDARDGLASVGEAAAKANSTANVNSAMALAVPPDHPDAVFISPFARRDYYAEAAARLLEIAKQDRIRFGGRRSDYRVLCNSPIPEKPLAVAGGVGHRGRNSLIITEAAGSLVVLAVLALPFAAEPESRLPPGDDFGYCGSCRACVGACPVGALAGDGRVDLKRCLQAYASSDRPVPPEIAERWGRRLYGCTVCQDLCPHNRRPIAGRGVRRGPLPAAIDGRRMIDLDNAGLRRIVAGTALGLSWLTPEILRRNAKIALKNKHNVDA